MFIIINMKYGNILKKNIEKEYEKYYIPYNKIKKNIKISSSLFITLLKKYIEITENFYINNKTEKDLMFFCLLNIFSVFKITKKYNKHNNINVTERIRIILHKQKFYKDLLKKEGINNHKINKECSICYENNSYSMKLNCCNNIVCWNCLLKCYLNNYNSCSYCRRVLNTNPIMISLTKLTGTQNNFYNDLLEKHNKKRILMIGLDGLRPDALLYSETPNIDHIINNGVFNFETKVNTITISGPSWSAIFTGQKISEIYDNESVEDESFVYKSSDIFSKLNELKVNTSSFVSSWSGMKSLVKNSKYKFYQDNHETYKNDLDAVNATNDYIKKYSNSDQFVYLYLNGIDHIGHKYGFSIQTEQYIEYIEYVDKILDKTLNSALHKNYSIIIVTDHGGSRKSDLDNKTTNIFDSINFVSGQVKKECKGIHGLDIPQHYRTFKLYHGDIVKNEKKEIIGELQSEDTFKDIINYYESNKSIL